MTDQELEDHLYQVDRALRLSGMRPLSPQELQAASAQVQARALAEGGLVNDRSGNATKQIRAQLGIR